MGFTAVFHLLPVFADPLHSGHDLTLRKVRTGEWVGIDPAIQNFPA